MKPLSELNEKMMKSGKSKKYKKNRSLEKNKLRDFQKKS